MVIGESLVDLVGQTSTGPFTAHAGGSPLNVAVGLARLGQQVAFITEYGDDTLGRLLDRHLRSSGVHVVTHHRPTSLAIAVPHTNGSTSYDFRFGWLLGRRDISIAGGIACLHTGSLAAVVDPGRRAIVAAARAANRARIPVCVDPNIRPNISTQRKPTRIAVEELVALADIVKASREDLAWLYPDEDPVKVLRDWVGTSRRLAVLTDGSQGAIAVHGDHIVTVPAEPVDVVDTVGAGDAFTAAMLSRLAATDALRANTSYSPELLHDVLTYATRVAGLTCTRSGAQPPHLSELR